MGDKKKKASLRVGFSAPEARASSAKPLRNTPDLSLVKATERIRMLKRLGRDNVDANLENDVRSAKPRGPAYSVVARKSMASKIGLANGSKDLDETIFAFSEDSGKAVEAKRQSFAFTP